MKAVKTQKTEVNVIDFLNAVADERRRQDGFALLELMREATGLEPKIWSASIIGFGDVHIKSESGREVDWFPVGFSPRATLRAKNFGIVARPSEIDRLDSWMTRISPLDGSISLFPTGSPLMRAMLIAAMMSRTWLVWMFLPT